MGPDPHTSGYVGVVPGVLLWLLFAWISRAQKKRVSKAEEKALGLFAAVTVYLVMLPLHFMIGLLIVGVLVFVSPLTQALIGLDVKAFVQTNIWVDGQVFSSVVWTAVIGAVPSLVTLFFESRKEPHEP